MSRLPRCPPCRTHASQSDDDLRRVALDHARHGGTGHGPVAPQPAEPPAHPLSHGTPAALSASSLRTAAADAPSQPSLQRPPPQTMPAAHRVAFTVDPAAQPPSKVPSSGNTSVNGTLQEVRVDDDESESTPLLPMTAMKNSRSTPALDRDGLAAGRKRHGRKKSQGLRLSDQTSDDEGAAPPVLSIGLGQRSFMHGELVRHRHTNARQSGTPAPAATNALSLREREALLAKQQFIVCDEIFADGRMDSHQMRRTDLFSYLDQATTQITKLDSAR